MRPLLASLVLLVLAAAGCGTSSISGTTTTTAGGPALEGRTFVSESVTENGADKPLAGSPIKVSFLADQFSAHPGCNSVGGSYHLDGTHLVTSELRSTMMACQDQALMGQDQWFSDFLGAGPVVVLDGDHLTLSTDTTTIVLLDEQVTNPDRPLVGTTWRLDTITTGVTAQSVPVGMTVELTMTDDQLVVTGLCNGFAAQASIDQTTLVLVQLPRTQIACGNDRDRVEQAVAVTLDGTVSYAIDGDQLTISNGTNGLVFRAS